MIDISTQETKKITGGGIAVGGWIGISAAVVFVIGLIDGFVRPLKCN